MPTGTGRGDGDEGSPTNLHIGYLERKDTGKETGEFKPYLRTGPYGRKIKPNGTIELNYRVQRFWLEPMSDDMNNTLINLEKIIESLHDKVIIKDLLNVTRPYIKLGIVENDSVSGEIEKYTDPETNPKKF